MKDKVNQILRDRLALILLVLGLLTLVIAAGVCTIQKNGAGEESPYLEIPQPGQIAREEKMDDPVKPLEVKKATDAAKETEKEQLASETKPQSNAGEDLAAEAGAGQDAASSLVLNFTESDKLSWPVLGNVVLDYSMDQTIYFPTLEQFKCNPGVVIQSDVSEPVAAPANARVTAIGTDEEIGNYVSLDLGNGYSAICGQLKEITAVEGEYLSAGQVLGYVSEPTKYYSVEGVNVFFELMHDGESIDPLDYMN